MLALLRPPEWELPLYLHVAGAMLLVGALTVAAAALLVRWRRPGDGPILTLTATWALAAAVPAWVLMRVGAEWLASRWGFEKDPDWVTVGRVTADAGVLVLGAALVATVVARRRAESGGGQTVARVAGAATTLLLLALLFAVWAMTVKRV